MLLGPGDTVAPSWGISYDTEIQCRSLRHGFLTTILKLVEGVTLAFDNLATVFISTR